MTTATTTSAADTVDMTPVAAPKSLLLTVRAKSPAGAFSALEKLLKLPGGTVEKRLGRESEDMSAVLAFAEEFNLAVALDPNSRTLSEKDFLFAFSVPVTGTGDKLLTSLEKNGGEVRAEGANLVRIRSKEMSCEFVRLPVNARLTCGIGATAYRELGPWLMKTLPVSAKPEGDVWARFEMAALRARVLPLMEAELGEEVKDLRVQMTKFGVTDPELLDVPALLLSEAGKTLNDLDHLDASFVLDPNAGTARAQFGVFWKGSEAWLTKASTPPASAPPESFLRLPKDADFASWSVGQDPALFAGIGRVLRKGVAKGLDFAPFDASEKQAIVDLVELIDMPKGAKIWASGSLETPRAPAPPPARFGAADAARIQRESVEDVIGWAIFGSDGKPEDVGAAARRAAALYERFLAKEVKRVNDQAKTANGKGDAEYWQRKKASLAHAVKVKVSDNPAGYPRGSVGVTVEIPFGSGEAWTTTHPERDWEKRPPAPKQEVWSSAKIQLVAVPDGQRVLVGVSANAEVLKKKLGTALSASATSDQLAGRSDLGELKKVLRGAGFISPGHSLQTLAKLDTHDRDLATLGRAIALMPNKGMGPILYTSTGQGGAAPSATVTFTLTPAWVEDLGVIVKRELSRD